MLTLISWRNVWRNKVRSLVLLGSIILGIWAGIFILSFSFGMSSQYVNIAIRGQISHIQIHNKDFISDKKIIYTIPGSQEIIQKTEAIPDVKAVSGRTIVNGMVSSTTSGVGVNITGIDPYKENSVTELQSHIIDGDYFGTSLHNQIIIGEKLSLKLKVKRNNKIVLTFQDVNGNITSGAFRVTGIFKTRNSTFDENNVFVNRTDLNAILDLNPGAVHEIAILLKDDGKLASVRGQLKRLFPGLLIQDWQEIAPDLRFVIDSFNETMYLFISIILLALTFGIINTMLMAVLERVRELGILMAIGMNKTRVFFMIMLETIYISILGGCSGIVLAYFSIHQMATTGINLSSFAAGLSAYGMDSIVYPVFPKEQYINILIMVIVSSIVAAIYPSYKALKLKPVNAIKKI